ncbi:PP2C family protein-serine/threonine phosphatase, partial [candidate division CSSED10-310 bacterium]
SNVINFLGKTVLFFTILSLLFQLFRWLSRKIFFKVRNRIIANYILTGLLPLTLIFLLIIFSVFSFMVQLVSFHLKQIMENEFSALKKNTLEFALILPGNKSPPEASLRELYGQMDEACCGLKVTIFAAGDEKKVLWCSDEQPLPRIKFSDSAHTMYLVFEDQIFQVAGRIQGAYYIQASVPLHGAFLDKIAHTFGGQAIFSYDFKDEELNVMDPSFTLEVRGSENQKIFSTLEKDSKVNNWINSLPDGIDYFPSYMFTDGKLYTPDHTFRDVIILGLIHTRYTFIISKFVRGALPDVIHFEEKLFWVIIFITCFFAFIELIALIISLFLSRSITKVIAQLHKKTTNLSRGDFSYQIKSERADQLGELATSFDQMSLDIQNLLQKVKEQERLEQELVIAQEVQRIFFPKSLPHIEGINLYGTCLPALMVSGDYYDFISPEDTRGDILDFFIGDISGKGISAALLMASSLTFLKLEAAKRPMQNLSQIVSNFNNHLFQYSTESKYSTLFYGRLNREAKILTYCNAGHLPPILIRKKNIFELTVGGIVPGIFPGKEYEEHVIELESNDLLVAYTDGFTEINNKEEEEFGDKRLTELILSSDHRTLEELHKKIVNTVQKWSYSPEQADDMTILMISID